MRTSAVDAKPRPNHRQYVESLRAMGPERRLSKAFELSHLTRQLFLTGLRTRWPDLSDEALRRLYLERIAKCHNRNY